MDARAGTRGGVGKLKLADVYLECRVHSGRIQASGWARKLYVYAVGEPGNVQVGEKREGESVERSLRKPERLEE